MNPLDRACHRPHGPDCLYSNCVEQGVYECFNSQCIERRGTRTANLTNCQDYLPHPRRIQRNYKRIGRRVLAAYCVAVAGVTTMYFGSLVILRIFTFLTTL